MPGREKDGHGAGHEKRSETGGVKARERIDDDFFFFF